MFETLGYRVRALRTKAGLSQTALGKRLAISKSAVSQLECGITGDPAASRIRDLAQILGVSTDYLLGLREEENEDDSRVCDDPVSVP